ARPAALPRARSERGGRGPGHRSVVRGRDPRILPRGGGDLPRLAGGPPVRGLDDDAVASLGAPGPRGGPPADTPAGGREGPRGGRPADAGRGGSRRGPRTPRGGDGPAGPG